MLGCTVGGCETGMTPNVDPPFEPKAEDLVGAWKIASGENALTQIQQFRGHVVEYVQFLDDVNAAVFCRHPDYGIVLNFLATYAVLDKTLIINSLNDAFDPITMAFDMTDVNSLSLRDVADAAVQLTREEGIPGSARCAPLRFVKGYLHELGPHSKSGYAFDGSRLWFTGQVKSQLYSLDPNNFGDMAGPTAVSGYTFVETAQGKDLWYSCFCVPYSKIERRNAMQQQTAFIDAQNGLMYNVSVESAAYDAVTRRLWVSSIGRDEILAIDLEAMPAPIVTASFPFQPMDDLAFDGKWLWGLDSEASALVVIDPVNGVAIETYLISYDYEYTRWVGLEMIGRRVMVVGERTIGVEKGMFIEFSTNFLPIPDSPPVVLDPNA